MILKSQTIRKIGQSHSFILKLSKFYKNKKEIDFTKELRERRSRFSDPWYKNGDASESSRRLFLHQHNGVEI